MKNVSDSVCLPYDEQSPDARAAAIEKERSKYRFSFETYEQLPMCEDLPRSEAPSLAWNKVVTGALGVAVKNSVKADRELGNLGRGILARAHEGLDILRELAHGDLSEAFNDIAAMLLGGTMEGATERVEDYRVFFKTIPVPPLAETWSTDAHFSRKPLAGNNMESLERVTTLDDAFALTDAHIRAVAGADDSLKAALEEGRLFVADFEMLKDLEPSDLGGRQRYVYTPKVAYVVPRGGELKVAGIQLESTPGADNPVFTPDDGWAWQAAKVHASVADCLVGALYHHHARTHLIAEPMCVAMHRQLAPNHPLRHLLEPHFDGTLYINRVGAQTVFTEHGLIDWIAAGTRDSVRTMCRKSVQSFDFNASALPAKLERRGLMDRDVLKDFPYRDDAMLVWSAIESWVREYMGIYYSSDHDVTLDNELQGWLREVSAVDGGGLKGVGERGAFRTREGVISAFTNIIYTVSAFHSAMNFPVSEEMAFVPNLPFAAYAPRPTDTARFTKAEFLATLPPLDAAQRQFDTAYLLGESRFGALGQYPEGRFEDGPTSAALKRFQEQLASVEREIDSRNETRTPYRHLKPSRIAPSINI